MELDDYKKDGSDLGQRFLSTYQGSGQDLPVWCSFALGAVVTFLLVYIGIARPASEEMARMRREIRALHQSISLIVAQEDALAESNSILARLTQQAKSNAAARSSLDRMVQLNRQLDLAGEQLTSARSSLSKLVAVNNDLIDAAEATNAASQAMGAIESLHERLVRSAESSLVARRASDELLALEEDLICRGHDIDLARETLDDLTSLRQRLDVEAEGVQSAHERLEGLVELKQMVISQTHDLPEAIETLELTADLHDQFQSAVASFQQMRTWMVDVVSLEPMLQRAMRSLEPLTELGNLRRLSDDQLRAAARSISERRQTQLARNPQNEQSSIAAPDLGGAMFDDTSLPFIGDGVGY